MEVRARTVGGTIQKRSNEGVYASMLMFDPMYLLFAIPGLILSLMAQAFVKSTFNRYAQVGVASGISGAQAAAELARARGVPVRIEPTHGQLSDHFDPTSNTLRLSPDVYGGRSVAALGVAAHEMGHALQKADNYFPMYIRSGLVPLVNFSSGISIWVLFAGLWFHSEFLQTAGILLFSAAVVFALVTLPVEFDASARAMKILRADGIVNDREAAGVRKVLTAAAMTYVAAAVSSVLMLLYYITLAGRDDR